MTIANDIQRSEFGTARRFWALIANLREQRQMRRDYRRTYAELSRLTDHDLYDLGIDRGSIREIARQAANIG